MLAGPILTPVVFLEDKAFSAKWPALTGRPLTSVGVSFYFYWASAGTSDQSSSTASTKPHHHLFPSKIRDVTFIVLAHVTPTRMVRAVERTILRNH